jgi:hypothetical protein
MRLTVKIPKGVDTGSRPEWDGIRQKYNDLVDWFIATVKDLFGMILVHGTSPFSCLSSCREFATKKR